MNGAVTSNADSILRALEIQVAWVHYFNSLPKNILHKLGKSIFSHLQAIDVLRKIDRYKIEWCDPRGNSHRIDYMLGFFLPVVQMLQRPFEFGEYAIYA